MPRRKRKVSGNRLRPLMFIESPVNIVRKMPSPVFASDHPATAEVVPVDNNHTWVSPQFITGYASCIQPRRSRRNLKYSNTVEQPNLINHTLPSRLCTAKYKPLAFVGFNGNEDDSVCISEEVNMKICKGNDSNPMQSNILLNTFPNANRLNQDERVENCAVLEENGKDLAIEDFISSDLSPIRTVINRDMSQFTELKSPTDANNDMQLTSTLINPKLNKQKRPHHQLFVNDDSFQEDFDLVPIRRLRQNKDLKENFFPNPHLNTPVGNMKSCEHVLALDTPEEQYGMPVRERQLHGTKLFDRVMQR